MSREQRLIVWGFAVGLVTAVFLSGVIATVNRSIDPVQARPDVVLVMADDMRPDEMDLVADLRRNGGFDWMRDNGTRFTTFSTDNLCCPGRATALTGQTAFNHGLLTNAFENLRITLPTWMRNRGYCTGFTGKYLNGYSAKAPRPPGWDYWEPLTTDIEHEHGYSMLLRTGAEVKPREFITDRLADVSRRQLRDCSAQGTPAMVALWPYAPHILSDGEPPYNDVIVPWHNADPSFGEADFSDKPDWLRRQYPDVKPALAGEAAAWNEVRVQTLLSVDDAIRGLIAEAEAGGRLDNTLFVLTSDNGYLMGEHRIMNRKQVAYEAAQPEAWIVGPGFTAGATSVAFASNIDIVPTILRAARVLPGARLDGFSLQEIAADPRVGQDRAVPFYVSSVDERDITGPDGNGIRTGHYKYVEYSDGSTELYDLHDDPNELENVVGDPSYARVRTDMQALMKERLHCAGDTCRAPAPESLR